MGVAGSGSGFFLADLILLQTNLELADPLPHHELTRRQRRMILHALKIRKIALELSKSHLVRVCLGLGLQGNLQKKHEGPDPQVLRRGTEGNPLGKKHPRAFFVPSASGAAGTEGTRT